MNKPPTKHQNLYSVKKQKPTNITYQLTLDLNIQSEISTKSTKLGVLDLEFTKTRPTYVELLLIFSFPIDINLFIQAVQLTIPSFPSICGRRQINSQTIEGTQGVKCTAITLPADEFNSDPPSPFLFHTPSRHSIHKLSQTHINDNQVLTLRLATADDNSISSLGLVFDHCLADVSGPSLFLSHISYHYLQLQHPTLTTSSMPPPLPTHDRALQSRIRLLETITEIETSESKTDNTTTITQQQQRQQRLKGGVACVEIYYSNAELTALKKIYQANSKHEAVYTDLILLLRLSKQTPMRTATISRDDRTRYGLDSNHFGNGVVMVDAMFEQSVGDDVQDGISIAQAIRTAVTTGIGRNPISVHADIHLNTWWHPLQKKINFNIDDTMVPKYCIGPGSLCASGQICIARNGQPNVTIVPADDGDGFKIYLLAKLKVAYTVAKKKGLKTKT